MSRYDPQRRRRLTTRANTTAVEALLDGEPSRIRTDGSDLGLVPQDVRHNSRISAEEPGVGTAPSTPPLAARSGCLSALLGLGRR